MPQEVEIFRTFSEARKFAKSQARSSNSAVPVARRESGWHVPTIQRAKRSSAVRKEETQEFIDALYGTRDYGRLDAYDSEVAEIHDEIGEYAENLSMSEEEGWFYDDENEDEAMRNESQRKDDLERIADVLE
jgi:hypothetical protein